MLRIIHAGVGGRGVVWTNAVHQMQDYESVAYVDIKPEVLAAEAAKYGISQEKCFSNLEDAVEELEADAMIISTPGPVHAEMCRLALTKNLHILVEKPFTTTIEDAVEIVQEAEKRNLTIMVGQSSRFSPIERTLKKILSEKSMGDLGYSVFVHHRYRPGIGSYQIDMNYPMLIEMSIHHFDSIRSAFGCEAVNILAKSWNPSWSAYKGAAVVSAIIEMENDIWLNYYGSFVSQTSFYNWRIECSQGAIGLENGSLYTLAPKSADRRTINIESFSQSVEVQMLNMFCEAIKNGVEPETSGKDNLKSLAMVFACIKSSEMGRKVNLSEVLE